MDLRESNKIQANATRHPWEVARENIVEDLIGDTLQKGEIIVDIGCGDLFLLENLNSRYGDDIYYYALDIALSDSEINSLNQQYTDKNIFVYNSMEKMQQDIKSEVKIVLLLDVIEHIENDDTFLKDLHQRPFIGAQSNIIITVPAYQFLFSSHDEFLGHYRRYTNQSLIKTIKQAGFDFNQCGYFFSSLVLVRTLQAIVEKIRKPDIDNQSTGLVTWKGSRFLTQVLTKTLLLDYKFARGLKKIKINLPGLSNYILCQKRA